ncbi:MAG: beta-lactamase family protein [Candidatus Aminicenantes bacterium]|nr:beta-lactamase family protein [Candidatus Aminicenantes bacterium]
MKDTPVEKELDSGPLMLRQVVGKMTVHSDHAEGEFVIDAIVKTEKFGWVKFKIELSPEPPHDLTGMGPYAQTSAPSDVALDKIEQTPEESDSYDDWKDLHDLIEQVRQECGAPGMAAAIVRGEKIVDKGATGLRRFDKPNRVQISDLWHIGSVTKTFTGTMIGKLLDKEVLQWDMTIGEVLPDIPMNPQYQKITLEQLLGHRAGVPSMPSSGEFVSDFSRDSVRTPAQARAALVQKILGEKPSGVGEYIYSNAGYVVAGFMTERAMKQSWEGLMRSQVFEPLDLKSAGFGWPAASDRRDQPYGHYGAAPELRVQEIGKYELFDIDAFGPAANIHCSIEDLARFAAFYLHVLDGQEDSLKPETVPRFWREGKTEEGKRLYGFFGSGGTFIAMIAVYPDDNLAVVAAVNIGLPAMESFKKMRDAIYHRKSQYKS